MGKNAQSWEIVGQIERNPPGPRMDGGSAVKRHGPGFLPGRPAASGLHERPAGAAECQGVNVMCKSYPKTKKCNSPKISVNPVVGHCHLLQLNGIIRVVIYYML